MIHNPTQPRMVFKPEWFEIEHDETPEGIKPDVNRPEYKV